MNLHRLGCLLLALGGSASAQLSFSDQTATAGLVATHAPPSFNVTQMLSGGSAGDFDADGWQDLFVTMGGGAPDALFMNDADGTFTDEAAAWGVDVAHVGGGTAAGDYDDDGRLDLFVASLGAFAFPTPGQHRLYRNDGGSFSNQAAAAGVTTTAAGYPDGFGATWGDMDLDGDLDLFVAGWLTEDTFLPLGNTLFANLGDGTFSEVTAAVIDVDLDETHGYSPLFIDMDGDRWPELLLTGDDATSHYLVNDGAGGFTDETVASGTNLDTNGMGMTVADFDRDGRYDWYVTSIQGDPGTLWEQGTGNMLYTATGDHVFQETSVAAGVKDGGWGWGTVAVDLDHDGWTDIAETNGWGVPLYTGEPSYLWLNDGDGTFTESAAATGFVHAQDGRGLLHFDADNDGDQDLVVFSNGEALRYFRNELSGPDTNWLTVVLDAAGQPGVAPDGLGARVVATMAGVSSMRTIVSGGTYLCTNELSAHFGLGAATVVDELRIEWPDGTLTYLADVPSNQRLVVSCCAGWKDLGLALGGTHGEPRLVGAGSLETGADVTLQIAGAPGPNLAFLFIGLANLSVPFQGGIFVPTPDALEVLPLDAAGGFSATVAWPPGLQGGIQLWWQAWIPDGGAPFGYAGTNGLRSTTP